MRIESLRYFVVAANCKSITLAGKILHISQQCISREIKCLENELGGQLFLRSKKGVFLTDEGMQAYERALQLLQQIDDFHNIFKLVQIEKTFVVGAYVGLKKKVENVLHIFEGIYPTISMDEYYFSTEKLEYEQKCDLMDVVLQQIERKKFDNLIKLDNYEHFVLIEENVKVSINEKFSKYIPSKFDMKEIGNYPILFYCNSTDEIPLYQKIAQQYGEVNIIYKGNSLEKIADLHNRKKSIVLVTKSLSEMVANESNLKLISTVQDISIYTVLSIRKEIKDLVIMKDLLKCFQDFFQQFV